jgi:hypothetical protein
MFHRGLLRNTTLCDMPLPIQDINNCMREKVPGTFHDILKEVQQVTVKKIAVKILY